MALTYPRPLPTYALSECTFELLEGVEGSAYAGGSKINLTQIDDKIWKCTIQTDRLDRQDAQAWSAWKLSLRAGFRRFVAYDQARSTPLAYLSARNPGQIFGGWAGSANILSLGFAGSVTLNQLPPAYIVSAGDRLGFVQSGKYAYHEVLETRQVDVNGAVSLMIAPFPQPIFTTAAQAVLWRPMAEFVIDWRSWAKRETFQREPARLEAYQAF